jgi:cold shock protein
MDGRVKWFSQEKGYGFLVGDDGLERFFGTRDVVGADLPSTGDEVSYEPREGAKGPAAGGVRITSKAKEKAERIVPEGKVECPHCHRAVYPRLVTYRGRADKSLCPLCGRMIRDFVGKWRWLPGVAVVAIVLVGLAIAAIVSRRERRPEANARRQETDVQITADAPPDFAPRAPEQAVGAAVTWARRERAAELQSWLRRQPPPAVCRADAADQSSLPDAVRYHLVDDPEKRRQLLAGLEPVLRLAGCPGTQGLVLYKGQSAAAFSLPGSQIAITPDSSYFSSYPPDEHIFHTLGILRLFLAREVFKQIVPVEEPGGGLTAGDARMRQELKVDYLAAAASLTVDKSPEILERTALDIDLYGNSKSAEDYTSGRVRSYPSLQQIQDVFGAARQDFKR